MTINYNPKITLRDRVKPARIVMTETQQGAVEPRGKTWGIRERGDLHKLAPQTYRCPVHGDFVVEVPLSAVPDVVPCHLYSWSVAGGDKEYASQEEAAEFALAAGYYPDQVGALETQRCAEDSPWAGSSCGIGVSSGEVES
jgi:hypothetical protein